MRRRPALALAGVTAASLVLSACSSAQPVEPQGLPAGLEASAPPAVPSAAPSAAPAASASPSPLTESPAASPSPARPRFTYDVAAAQKVLRDGGYYVGPLDGRSGSSMRSAVMAFQKVNGLGADGAVGPATLQAFSSPKAPVLRGGGPADRVEVDLTRQVLYIVKGGRLSRIMPVSSGNGRTYEQKDGSTARALTPVGYYTIQRRIVGERKADLGTLYDPQYFYQGWAIHGSNSVPAGPASHGCVRVTRPDAKYLLDVLRNGMTVHLYGGTHTFSAGSSAPGTSNPTGDTPSGTAPSPAASPATSAKPAPSAAPSSAPSSAPSPSASPSRAATAAPSPSASAASPRPSASAR